MALTEEQKAYQRAYYLKNRDKKLAYLKEYNSERTAKKAEYDKEYRVANREEINRKKNLYRLSTGKARQWLASKRARKISTNLLKGDEWNDFVLSELYHLRRIRSEETGIGWHVDHVVPLKGEVVSGFHVWYNLELIPAAVNLKKGNSFFSLGLEVGG